MVFILPSMIMLLYLRFAGPARLRLLFRLPLIEHFNIENVYLPCKDLPANPCREIIARQTCFAVKR
jgi:hypothetical protein